MFVGGKGALDLPDDSDEGCDCTSDIHCDICVGGLFACVILNDSRKCEGYHRRRAIVLGLTDFFTPIKSIKLVGWEIVKTAAVSHIAVGSIYIPFAASNA